MTQTNGSNNRTSAFNLTAGQTYNNADLGYQPAAGTAVIGDRVWSDADGDGVQDAGEPGLAGVTVRIYTDANGNGAIDGGETFVETTTAANGSYQFSVTANGTEDYIVFVDPDQSALSAYDLTTQDTFFFEDVADGGSYLIADVGVQQESSGTTYSITDRVWLDGNMDSEDDGENGIAGITVALLDASGNVIATTTTDANGGFTFTGVPAGVRYSWRITDQNNVLNNYFGTTSEALAGVFQMPGVLTGDLDYTAEPTEPHFGYNLNRSIGDTVFNDLNGNGAQEPGEPGLSGVVVRLYNDADGDGIIDGGTDTVQATLTTDANGNYLFSGLSDGDYIVSIESPPVGYAYVQPGQPADSDGTTSGQQRSANITGGVSDLDNDFGYQAGNPRTLSGRLWNDANEDGDDESGAESGLENVTIELYEDTNGNGIVDSGDARIGTTSTASDGSYSFAGLPGNGSEDYIVRITDDNGVLSGYQTTYEKTEGTGGGYNDLESVLNLNGDVTDLNFGYAPVVISMPITLASLEAHVVEDGLSIVWTTATETRNAGFHLYGRLHGEEEWQRLTKQLIPSKVIDSLDPQRYSAHFPGVVADEVLLEDWDSLGQTEQHGPFSVGRLHGFDAVAHSKRIDWVAIRAENAYRQTQRSFNLARAVAGQPDALLWVSKPGIQRISFDALQAAGADFSTVSVDELALTDNGKARSRHIIDANNNSLFDTGDSVEFV
ncbi:MAG: SdrD B-like domain-containing protein, partial [Candidatus Competibacteraceae bacterium]